MRVGNLKDLWANHYVSRKLFRAKDSVTDDYQSSRDVMEPVDGDID